MPPTRAHDRFLAGTDRIGFRDKGRNGQVRNPPHRGGHFSRSASSMETMLRIGPRGLLGPMPLWQPCYWPKASDAPCTTASGVLFLATRASKQSPGDCGVRDQHAVVSTTCSARRERSGGWRPPAVAPRWRAERHEFGWSLNTPPCGERGCTHGNAVGQEALLQALEFPAARGTVAWPHNVDIVPETLWDKSEPTQPTGDSILSGGIQLLEHFFGFNGQPPISLEYVELQAGLGFPLG